MIYGLQNQVAQSLAAPFAEKQLEIEGAATQTTYFPVIFNNYRPPEWEYLGLDGDVTDVVFDPANPQHAFATVYLDGLYETNDSGMTWVKNETITFTNRFNDIEVHPITSTTWFVAAWSNFGVFQSSNNGQIWLQMESSPPLLYSMAIHPLSPTVMFVGTGNWEFHGGEMYKSVDAGGTWDIVSPVFTNALTFVFDSLNPNIIYAGTRGGVWKSVDGGETWNPAKNGLPGLPDCACDVTSLVFHPNNTQWLYAATRVGVYVSYDGAENWQPLWEGIDANALLFDPNDPTKLYLGTTDAGMYISSNDGLSWTQLGLCGLGFRVNHLALNPSNFNELWAATDSGLWRCVIH
ncbi:WD40/YVTN/BNR-like repeat-containing protein [Candidatus Leptofilum sp.]|uniref:WD40/YVTN/BNR-like repeat-containing protein n=1 Tax=Candidatus Leptofilum sp. TaxID=3241576 RepID=UPI003B59F54E